MNGDDWRPSSTLEMSMRRAAMLERIRRYFADTGALEVTTPALVQAPVTDVHIESLEVFGRQSRLSGFLQTSPEYAMKRLLSAGWPDIYQISPVFRGGERGRLHNPEFTMIEWYRLGIDHHALMDDVDRMLRAAFHIALQPESSKRLTYQDAFIETLELDPFECPLDALQEAIAANGIPVPNSLFGQRDALLDIALSSIVAHRFPVDRITFLYDFPASQAALARIRGPVASRFEAFWGETELANGFHELVDPAEQKLRFEADLAGRRSRGQPSPAPDQRFLAALAAGLPDCAGVAMGLDRMLMIASGAARIDDVIAFPFERA